MYVHVCGTLLQLNATQACSFPSPCFVEGPETLGLNLQSLNAAWCRTITPISQEGCKKKNDFHARTHASKKRAGTVPGWHLLSGIPSTAATAIRGQSELQSSSPFCAGSKYLPGVPLHFVRYGTTSNSSITQPSAGLKSSNGGSA